MDFVGRATAIGASLAALQQMYGWALNGACFLVPEHSQDLGCATQWAMAGLA